MAQTSRQLVKARKTRSEIAQLFSQLENHHITVLELLEGSPRCLARIQTYNVLRRVPHLDRAGAEKVLRLAKVWPLKPFGTLTPEERRAIITHLPPRVKA